MPSSQILVVPKIVAITAEVKPKAVLDVGPGYGKYGVLVREYVRPKKLEAIEAEPRYLEQFPWNGVIYDSLVLGDVTEQSDEFFSKFDLVLMIDVLEHLDREVGAELLARIPGRIVICTPADFFQNPEAHHGWETERHRSVWTAAEIAEIRPLEIDDAEAEKIGGVLVRTAPL